MTYLKSFTPLCLLLRGFYALVSHFFVIHHYNKQPPFITEHFVHHCTLKQALRKRIHGLFRYMVLDPRIVCDFNMRVLSS